MPGMQALLNAIIALAALLAAMLPTYQGTPGSADDTPIDTITVPAEPGTWQPQPPPAEPSFGPPETAESAPTTAPVPIPLPPAELAPAAPAPITPTPPSTPAPPVAPAQPGGESPLTPAATGYRGVPISPAGFLGQFNLSSSSYVMANRFILASDVTIDRWYFAMNGEGANCVGGRDGYGSGNGGVHYGRIVNVDQSTGLPTEEVLASETVNACEAYERIRSEFGLSSTHQAQYVEFPPLALQAGQMYAFVLSNTDPDPGSGGGASSGNHMSPNLNFADLEEMGPHGANTLDPNAPEAAYGLDPRETTMWSEDSGTTWQFGDRVGWYDVGDGSGRMWPGGYRVAGGSNVPHGWVYMNWPGEGAATITHTATTDASLTEAGGASSDGGVGVITVENLDTGVTATTESLSTGLVSGPLSQSVPVATGQRYEVRTSGVVDTGSAGFWDQIFELGTAGSAYESDCSNCNSPTDRPMLYAAA